MIVQLMSIASVSIVLFNIGSSMLVVGVISSSPLSVPFSLYVRHCNRMCECNVLVLRAMFTVSTKSAYFFSPFTFVSAFKII